MSNEWYLGDVRIVTTEYDEDLRQIIARLTPLASGTILQTFGWEDIVSRTSSYIVGTADRVTLLQYSRSGLSYTLSGYGINWGEFKVNSVKLTLVPSIRQTIRRDLPIDDMVTIVDMELFKDE